MEDKAYQEQISCIKARQLNLLQTKYLQIQLQEVIDQI